MALRLASDKVQLQSMAQEQGAGMRRVKQGGFTLMELMITVAIVGILASVAYPSYITHIIKTKRNAAESFMMTVANRQEQTMLNARSYFAIATGTAAEWTAAKLTLPAEVSGNYTVTVAADNTATPPTFTVTATPSGTQAAKDTKCGTLTLDQTGTRTKSGTAASYSDCW
jgi:type IV pilus assembly protein PilE